MPRGDQEAAPGQLGGVEAVLGIAVGGELQEHQRLPVLAGVHQRLAPLVLRFRVEQVGLDGEARRGPLLPLLAQRLAPEEQGVALLAVGELGVGAGAGQEEVARLLGEVSRRQRPGGEAAGKVEEPLLADGRRAVLGSAEQVEGVLPAVGEVGLHDLVAPPLQVGIGGGHRRYRHRRRRRRRRGRGDQDGADERAGGRQVLGHGVGRRHHAEDRQRVEHAGDLVDGELRQLRQLAHPAARRVQGLGDLALVAAEAQVVEGERRLRVEDQLLAHQRRHRHVHLLLGGEAGDAGEDELRHLHLERGLGGRRLVEPAQLPLVPGEEVEQLLGQVLLQDAEEVGGRHQPVLQQDLAEGDAARGRAGEAGREVLLAELPLGHHEAPQGLVGQVRAAVDGDAVLDQDALPDLPAPQLQHERALAQGMGEEEGRERHLREGAFPPAGDLLQLLGSRNHRRNRMCRGVYRNEEEG